MTNMRVSVRDKLAGAVLIGFDTLARVVRTPASRAGEAIRKDGAKPSA
ncbi:MAG TPA: hypothetical protein VKU90_12990 [Caulobacteraceae bacterium]|nr:hypothetical protein [Caulobacteraceae bacterium]